MNITHCQFMYLACICFLYNIFAQLQRLQTKFVKYCKVPEVHFTRKILKFAQNRYTLLSAHDQKQKKSAEI